jgi:hypothetical protein
VPYGKNAGRHGCCGCCGCLGEAILVIFVDHGGMRSGCNGVDVCGCGHAGGNDMYIFEELLAGVPYVRNVGPGGRLSIVVWGMGGILWGEFGWVPCGRGWDAMVGRGRVVVGEVALLGVVGLVLSGGGNGL